MEDEKQQTEQVQSMNFSSDQAIIDFATSEGFKMYSADARVKVANDKLRGNFWIILIVEI